MDIATATLILGVATLVLSAVIACVTSYIAIQQWQTARNKFRLDLFNRRFPVFEEAMRLTTTIIPQPGTRLNIGH
jgi:hypothetical protein